MAEPLAPGDRFRLTTTTNRRAVFGLGLTERGTLTVPHREPVELVLDGADYRVATADGTWRLALEDDQGRPQATYTPGRKRRGTITTTVELALDIGKDGAGGVLGDRADITAQNGAVLVVPRTELDPLVAAFVATVVHLRGNYELPAWTPSTTGWWGRRGRGGAPSPNEPGEQARMTSEAWFGS